MRWDAYEGSVVLADDGPVEDDCTANGMEDETVVRAENRTVVHADDGTGTSPYRELCDTAAPQSVRLPHSMRAPMNIQTRGSLQQCGTQNEMCNTSMEMSAPGHTVNPHALRSFAPPP